jgi:hypothetical protein
MVRHVLKYISVFMLLLAAAPVLAQQQGRPAPPAGAPKAAPAKPETAACARYDAAANAACAVMSVDEAHVQGRTAAVEFPGS